MLWYVMGGWAGNAPALDSSLDRQRTQERERKTDRQTDRCIHTQTDTHTDRDFLISGLFIFIL